MHAHLTSHVYHRHSHESYSFGLTESGAQEFTCRRGHHVSAAGMVMTFNPEDPHDGHSAVEDGFTYWMVHVWPEFFESRPLPLFRTPVLDDQASAVALRRVCRALSEPATSLERHERLTSAVNTLTRHASGTESGLGRADGTGRVFGAATAGPGQSRAVAGTSRGGLVIAQRIRSLLHDRATEDVTAGDLATIAGSRFAAYRAFTAAYGLTPSDYQRQLRIRMARRLLVAGWSPGNAAAEAGFADQAHLTRWFRRYYGITPAAYQRALLL
jgi:AraC-like DNA-binding protein